MAYRRLPSEMRERITDYYDYRYHGKMFTESVIFDEISVKLREVSFRISLFCFSGHVFCQTNRFVYYNLVDINRSLLTPPVDYCI